MNVPAPTWCLLLACCTWPMLVRAQLEVVADRPPQEVFADGARQLRVVFHNATATNLDMDLRTQLYQAAGAAAAPIGASPPWKQLHLAAGQTTLDSIVVDFPAVRAETKFLLQWLTDSNRVIGLTEVRVYPTNLLTELKPLLAGRPLGILDPQNKLKPLLKNLKQDFVDLADTGFENFSGRLAIIGPFESKVQMHDGLLEEIKALAQRKTAVVWLQPPPEKRDKPLPSFYSVIENTNAVVVVQANLVADLTENPRAQLDLVYLCTLAMRPEPFRLPDAAAEH